MWLTRQESHITTEHNCRKGLSVILYKVFCNKVDCCRSTVFNSLKRFIKTMCRIMVSVNYGRICNRLIIFRLSSNTLKYHIYCKLFREKDFQFTVVGCTSYKDKSTKSSTADNCFITIRERSLFMVGVGTERKCYMPSKKVYPTISRILLTPPKENNKTRIHLCLNMVYVFTLPLWSKIILPPNLTQYIFSVSPLVYLQSPPWSKIMTTILHISNRIHHLSRIICMPSRWSVYYNAGSATLNKIFKIISE